MSNDQVYAAGLLTEALDPAHQPEAIRAFLADEEALVHQLLGAFGDGLPDVVDLGCGTGRHLGGLAGKVGLGLGIDYEPMYIREARRLVSNPQLHFVVADATRVPVDGTFDFALCLTSSWGTMSDKSGVLEEMKRLAPEPGSRLVTVYAPSSVPFRTEWYGRLGHPVAQVADDHILTEDGFRSEHYGPDRIRELVGPCVLHPIGEVAFLVQA
ncbi:MAG: class I SAM-dependent methyltransferase [Gemmatimonadetes bacterium]|nr:class I SAM-dependent methyltransferase [Gemmatimonadota bacterium]